MTASPKEPQFAVVFVPLMVAAGSRHPSRPRACAGQMSDIDYC
jgi:hypothetical protein